MKVKKLMKRCLYGIVAGAMVISSTVIDVNAIADNTMKANALAYVKSMTVEKKAAQMIHAETADITPAQAAAYGIGSIFSGGGSAPSTGNTLEDWAYRLDEFQQAMKDAGKLPLIYGVDSVHGNNNVYGATVFPHNIGLGAANNTELMEEIGKAVTSETVAIGANLAYSPMIGSAKDERWGRYYESYSDDAEIVSNLGAAYIRGLQSSGELIGSAKHYLGEGITTGGTNKGNVVLSDEDYTALINADTSNAVAKDLLTPYIDAISSGVGTVMASYNSINGVRCHGNKDVLTTLLKDKLGFEGIVVSDYNGVDDLSGTYAEKVVTSVNAGIDLLMVAGSTNGTNKWLAAYNAIVAAANNTSDDRTDANYISEERLNDAVYRIILQKFKLGLINEDGSANWTNAFASEEEQELFGSDEHRTLARQAVSESLVLLKNTQYNDEQTIMEALSGMKNIGVAGSNAHNLGNQCGGWTIAWQGQSGNTCTEGTTIYQGIKEAVNANGGNVYYSATGYIEKDIDAAIVVVGETPYAESNGDASASSLKLSDSDLATIEAIKEDHPDTPIILMLVTGRPLTIADQVLDDSIAAVISAWLPGTEGAGVADVLFGVQDFTGRLPVTWAWYSQDVEEKLTDDTKVLFKTGYGLTKSQVSNIDADSKPADPTVTVFNETGSTTIQAEDTYDRHSSITLENDGTTVAYLEDGRYLSYKIKTTQNATYDLTIRANAQDDQTDVFEIYVDDMLVLSNEGINVPAQGDWTTFVELENVGQLSIPEGEHILKVVARKKDFNLDWYKFTVNADAEYVEPQAPETPGENVGTGAILQEGAVKVSMSSSENSGSMTWYDGNQKISNKNADKDSLDLRTVDDSTITTINVDATTEYQSFLGMGTSIDESTINNLWKMDEDTRYQFIKNLVDPVNGSGMTLFRLTIATPDFVACDFYSYYDGTGTELNGEPDWYNETGNGFSIQKDHDYHIIDTIKLIQKAAEECEVEDQIKFFASPWSPPGWMKEETSSSKSYPNNELLLKGGKLSDNHINDAAKYYVRYLEEYAKLGIEIYAMTLQNEPLLEINYPSCYITAAQEAKLATAIKAELAASTILTDEQKDVKVWAFDHNPGDLNSYMGTVYGNASDAVDGAAVHDYGGELSNMTTLHNNYNEKSIHLTERSVWGTTGADRIAQYFRNYAESYNCWVTMLDSNISTHQWTGTPDPTAFVQDAEDPENYWATPEVYLMAQFSKYIRPGYVRVQSNYGSSSTVTNVVFKNPETNELIMVAINNTTSDQNFKVVQNGVQFNATLPAGNCATYIWTAAEGDPVGLEVPGTLHASDAKDVSGMTQPSSETGAFENTTAGAKATYLIDVKEAGYYNVAINHSIGPTSGPSVDSNTEDKVLILYADGKEIGRTITNRFDTWSSNWNAWGTYREAQIQVYLEKGVQNLTIETLQESINIADLTFTKTKINNVPGLIMANNYSYGEGILLENGNVAFVETNDIFEYKIDVEKAGTYAMKLAYACANDKCGFDLYLDDQLIKNVSLDKTGTDWNTFGEGIVERIDLPEGQHTLRFVPNDDGGFNLQSFSFGSYVTISYENVFVEGAMKNYSLTVTLTDGTFIDELSKDGFTFEGLPGNIDYTVERVDDHTAIITFTGEIDTDFDSNLDVTLCVDASQIGEEGFRLRDDFTIIGVNDAESITADAIENGATEVLVKIDGGTFNKEITQDDVVLSDSLATYIKVTGIELTDEGLIVKLSKVKENYVDVAGTITVNANGYSEGNIALEAETRLIANPEGPTPIELSQSVSANLSGNAYDASGNLSDAAKGDYENYYIDVKEAGEYILEYNISNNNSSDTSGGLSINGGLGLGSTNNLYSVAVGQYYGNGGIAYRTIVTFSEAGLYTIQLRANTSTKFTNIKMYALPAATVVGNETTLKANTVIDGSNDSCWAIENGNNIGYTTDGAYMDYLVDVQKAGYYTFTVETAYQSGSHSGTLSMVKDGQVTALDTVDVIASGAWGNYVTSSSSNEFYLPEGQYKLRFTINGGFNVKDINLTYIPAVTPEFTVEKETAIVYVGETQSITNILGLNVVLGDEDITDSVTISSQYDPNTVGEYEVTITALDSHGQEVSKVYMIKVVNIATLTFDSSELTVGDTFDPLTNITVKDVDGSDITDKVIVVENNVDTTKPGEYLVKYQVVDGLGNTVTFVRKVVVKDKTDTGTQPENPTTPETPVNPGNNNTTVEGEIQTSDNASLLPYALLIGFAFIGMVLILRRRKEENE